MITSRRESWGPYLAAAGVALSLTLLVLAAIYTYRQQELVNHRLCKQTIENREATRQTWDAARGLILRGQPTEEQRTSTNRFFDAILETIPPLECRDNKPVVKEE